MEKEKTSVKKESKSTSKKKIVIISIIIVLIIAIATVTAIMLIQNNEKDKDEKTITTGNEYGDATLKILDSEEISKYEKVKLSYIDIDLDGIQDLIIKYLGLKVEDETKANQQIKIYKMSDDKQYVNKVNIGVNNQESNLDLQFVYNKTNEEYQWLGKVSDDDKVIYYELKNQLEGLEEADKQYKEDSKEFKETFVKVDTEMSKEIEITGEMTKKELKDKVNEALQGYITVETMIENKKELPISKVDESKDVVYTALKIKNFEYPIINLTGKEIENINAKIKEKFGFTNEDITGDSIFLGEVQEISYEYYINDNILSLVLKEGGNDSTWYGVYNIDMNSNTEIASSKLLNNTNFTKDAIVGKITSIADEYFKKDWDDSKTKLSKHWTSLGYEGQISKWKEEMHKSITNLERIYLNENRDLCIIIEYQSAGGQWTCTHSIEVNISQDCKARRLEYTTLGKNNASTQNDEQQNSVKTETNTQSSNQSNDVKIETSTSNNNQQNNEKKEISTPNTTQPNSTNNTTNTSGNKSENKSETVEAIPEKTLKVGDYALHYGKYEGSGSKFIGTNIVSATITITLKEDGTYTYNSTNQDVSQNRSGTYSVQSNKVILNADESLQYIVAGDDYFFEGQGSGHMFSYQGK